LGAAILEPVGRADQPWALVPRIAWVQGLIARIRDDRVLARRRFEEAAAGWRWPTGYPDFPMAQHLSAEASDSPLLRLREGGPSPARGHR